MNAKFYYLISFLTFCSFTLMAQDIIVKTDKTEIKSKVLEITETTIKYKKWQMQDGPIYNINKNEVFMVIYANGQREVIKPAVTAEKLTNSNLLVTQQNNVPNFQKKEAQIDTALDFKNIKIKYKPTRVYVGLQSPFGIGIDQEFRLLKNSVNFGFGYGYQFPKSDDIVSVQTGILYLSYYAPINRLSGNFKEQDRGLFVFAHAGYGGSSVKFNLGNGDTESVTSYDFTWRLGADYNFGDLAVSLFSQEFKTFHLGLSTTF